MAGPHHREVLEMAATDRLKQLRPVWRRPHVQAADDLAMLVMFSLGGLAADCVALRLQGAGAWLLPAEFFLIAGAPGLAGLAALSCCSSRS